MSNPDQNNNGKAPVSDMPFFSHLAELRDRLVRSVIVVLLIFGALFYFANDLYALIAKPMLEQLVGHKMIATKPISPFVTPLKLTLVVSIFIAVPFLLHQIWAFVAPGLYRHEKRMAFPLLFSSTVLFYVGMAFAYFLVFPMIFKFLATSGPAVVEVQPDISEYLDFVLALFLAFGVAFEVPVATVLVVMIGLVTPEQLAGMRRYIIVIAFIVAMLLTPPEVVSQVMLAIPMWLLFEIGLLVARLVVRRRARADDQAEEMSEQDMEREFENAIAEEAQLVKKIEEREKNNKS